MTWLEKMRVQIEMRSRSDLAMLASAVAKRSKNQLVVLTARRPN